MRKILFILCLLWAVKGQAQGQLIDSLTAALTNPNPASAQVDLHLTLSKEYYLSDIKKGLEHARYAYTLANKANLPIGKATALNQIGQAHLVQGDFDKGMACHYQALKLGEKYTHTSTIINSYISLGTMYFKTKDPDRALAYYTKASQLAQKTGDQLSVSRVYNNVGNIYEEKGDYGKALESFKQAAQLQEKLGNKKSLVISLQNIGNVHIYLSHPELGLPYLFKSLKIADEVGNRICKSGILKSIAQIYQVKNNTPAALQYAKLSYDEALETNSSKKIAASAQLLQSLYAGQRNYEQAFTYLSVFVKHEALLGLENQKKVAAELTTRYETEKKERENENLKIERQRQNHEIKQQQITIAFGVVVVIVMLILVLMLYQNGLHLKATSHQLAEANRQLQHQHVKISQQKNELAAQSLKLKLQNEELEKNNNFKNKIFSVISHDLRTPFGSIKSVLDLVQCHPMSAEEVQPIFKLLSKDVDVSLDMLNNLLVWSKAQLTETNITLQPVNLHRLVQENIQLAASNAGQKNIKLINDIAPGAVVVADKERLNFILRNLLMNAVKFTFAGGEVRLYTRQEPGNETTIAVADNGQGISPRHLLKLFTEDRFTTLGTAREKGTGLGLMLCKEFAESLQGHILVKSEEGAGTTFYIKLPQPLEIPVAEETALALV
jgi:two-component system, sensor histidine kinase and response regulator